MKMLKAGRTGYWEAYATVHSSTPLAFSPRTGVLGGVRPAPSQYPPYPALFRTCATHRADPTSRGRSNGFAVCARSREGPPSWREVAGRRAAAR
jgi:hypothetical protein